jgi:hypothetical protein
MLMVLVLLAGAGVGGYVLRERSIFYWWNVKIYMMQEDHYEEFLRRHLEYLEKLKVARVELVEEERKYPATAAMLRRVVSKTALDYYNERIESSKSEVGRDQALRDYYRALRLKYRWLTLCPWLPVAPDPPEPE